MAKHTQEQAIDTCTITIRPKLEIKYKLLLKAKYKMTVAKVVQSICEEAVKNVKLTKKELEAVQADMKANYDKRMRNRIKIAAFNRGLSEEAYLKSRR